jgi:hypothetical protein
VRYFIELDIAFDDEAPLKECVDELTEGLLVVPSVVTMQGPGGGWPLVRFSADDREELLELIDRYWADDSEQAEWAKDELIVDKEAE